MAAGRLYETVTAILEDLDLQHELDPEAGLAAMMVELEGGEFRIVMQTDEEAEICVCYALHPAAAEADRLAAVQELVTRLNLGLALGNYDLDLADGLVRFRIGLDLEGLEELHPLITRTLQTVVNTVDALYPAFDGVQTKGMSVAEALAAVELTADGEPIEGEGGADDSEGE